MNTWLYLTAEGLVSPSTQWPCCLWSSAGQRRPMSLSEVAQALDGQAVDLLLPMELCSWVCTEPWPTKRHPGAQAIAFAVENQLADAIENLHLGIGARDREGHYPVMVINRVRFAEVLALLEDSGIEVRSVFVDADVLPGTGPVVVRWFGRWLVGAGASARVAMEDAGLAVLRPLLPADTRWIDERHDAVDIDPCLTLDHPQAINLLQGPFAARRQHLSWRLGALALLTILLLTWGASASRIEFLDGETRRLASQNEQRFTTLYPDQTRIVDLVTQLKVLQSQAAEPQKTRIDGLSNLIEQVVGASPVEVRRIEYRAGDGWRLQLTANSFAELEQLRERGRQQGMPVRLDSANKEGNRVQATLTVEDTP